MDFVLVGIETTATTSVAIVAYRAWRNGRDLKRESAQALRHLDVMVAETMACDHSDIIPCKECLAERTRKIQDRAKPTPSKKDVKKVLRDLKKIEKELGDL